MADSMTVLRLAGPAGVKRNLVVMGDGFTAADQGTFNSYVQTALMEGVFGRDYFSEDASAYNIYRINLESVDSGVSQRRWNLQGTPGTGDDTILTDTTRDTALGIIFNAEWSHCWLEYGGNSEARITAAINTWVPDANNVLIVLNEPGFGGCGGGGRAHVTLGVAWDVIAHEFGHGIGGFADEYSAGGAYMGADLGWINVTTVTDRATTRWRQFIDPATPLPTGVGAAANYNQGPRPPGWSSNFDVGLFEGGNTQNTGIYRPVENCRMNGNTPEFCPVCYTSMKTARHAETAHRFDNAYAGNLYGSGRSDVLLHHGASIRFATATQASRTRSAVSRACRARGSSRRTTRCSWVTSTVTASTRWSSSTRAIGSCRIWVSSSRTAAAACGSSRDTTATFPAGAALPATTASTSPTSTATAETTSSSSTGTTGR